MVAPCGWDSSAAARNDSQERLGGVRMVAPCTVGIHRLPLGMTVKKRLGGAKGWLPHARLGFLGCRSEWQTRVELVAGQKRWLPHAVGIPRLPLGMADKRSGVRGQVLVVGHCWDSSAAARNDSQRGAGRGKVSCRATVGIPRLPLGMTVKERLGMSNDGCRALLGFLGCRSE